MSLWQWAIVVIAGIVVIRWIVAPVAAMALFVWLGRKWDH